MVAETETTKPCLIIVSGMRGKGLIAECVLAGLKTNAVLVIKSDNDCLLDSVGRDDVILLSDSGAEREEWMKLWIERFGEPLYDIIVRRNRK